MLEPKYRITTTLLGNISQIERLYGQIEALQLPQELQLNLTRKNLIKSAYASNKIEGNPLTLPEVTNLLLDDRVPATRDEKEVVNYYQILQDLDTNVSKPFDLNLINNLHARLMAGVDETAGKIRDVKVVVGKYKEEAGDVSLRVKHDPPFHTKAEIEKALSLLLDWAENLKDTQVAIATGLFHHQFVYLHPFEDGNGRVCRILTALLFLKHNYNINKYFILDDYYDIDRDQYSDKLHSADEGDKTQWLEYYSEGVKYSLQSALARAKEAILTLKIEDRPTPREREVLKILQERREVASSYVADVLHVTRQQAHGLLKGLVQKGLIEKKGGTKASYYVLK